MQVVSYDFLAGPPRSPHYGAVTYAELDRTLRQMRRQCVRWAEGIVPGRVAEDVAQEALLALAKRPDIAAADAPRWLRETVRRIALDTWRRMRREVPVAEVPHEAADVDPETTLASAEVSQALRDAVARMPESRRALVILAEDVPASEVGRRLGIPERTARHWVEQARGELRETLERRDHASKSGFRSWCIAVVALLDPRALWRRIKFVRVTIGKAVVALGAIGAAIAALGGAPPHIDPAPDEPLVRAVEVEPLRWPSNDARAERGRDAQPSKNPGGFERARHDAGKRFRAERFGRYLAR